MKNTLFAMVLGTAAMIAWPVAAEENGNPFEMTCRMRPHWVFACTVTNTSKGAVTYSNFDIGRSECTRIEYLHEDGKTWQPAPRSKSSLFFSRGLGADPRNLKEVPSGGMVAPEKEFRVPEELRGKVTFCVHLTDWELPDVDKLQIRIVLKIGTDSAHLDGWKGIVVSKPIEIGPEKLKAIKEAREKIPPLFETGASTP